MLIVYSYANLNILQKVSATENPKSAYHKVMKERGGIRSVLSPSDLP